MISGHAHQHGHGHSRFGNGLPITKTSQKQWYHHRTYVHIYIYTMYIIRHRNESKQHPAVKECYIIFLIETSLKKNSCWIRHRCSTWRPRDQFRWCPSDSLLHVGRCVGSLAAAKWTKGRRCRPSATGTLGRCGTLIWTERKSCFFFGIPRFIIGFFFGFYPNTIWT